MHRKEGANWVDIPTPIYYIEIGAGAEDGDEEPGGALNLTWQYVPGEKVLPESEEENPGAFLSVDDYAKIVLSKGIDVETMKLTWNTDKIKVWDSDTWPPNWLTDEVTSGITYNDASKTLWVQAVGAGAVLRDTTLILSSPSDNDATIDNINMSLIKVKFSASQQQEYGYDDMDDANSNNHHISLRIDSNDYYFTYVNVTIDGGLEISDLYWWSDNSYAVFMEESPIVGTDLLRIRSAKKDVSKDSAVVRASLPSQMYYIILGTLNTNCYKYTGFTAEVAKVEDSTVLSTELSRPNFDIDIAESFVNEWYSQAVVNGDISDFDENGWSYDVEYDLNNNGYLDIEINDESQEYDKIFDELDFWASRNYIVIVKHIIDIAYLKNAASENDTTISVKDEYSQAQLESLSSFQTCIGFGNNMECIQVTEVNGSILTLSAPLAKNHDTSDGIWFEVLGLAGFKVVVAENGLTELGVTKTIAHECGHRWNYWHDVNESDNLMGRTSGARIRYKEIQKLYEEGTESQWEVAPR